MLWNLIRPRVRRPHQNQTNPCLLFFARVISLALLSGKFLSKVGMLAYKQCDQKRRNPLFDFCREATNKLDFLCYKPFCQCKQNLAFTALTARLAKVLHIDYVSLTFKRVNVSHVAWHFAFLRNASFPRGQKSKPFHFVPLSFCYCSSPGTPLTTAWLHPW